MALDFFAALPSGLVSRADSASAHLEAEKFPKRLWDRDATLWKRDPEHQRIILNALGWLNVSHFMLDHIGEVHGFVEQVRREGYRHAVVLGMGGSSLCPDVCRETFEPRSDYLRLEVLDSTDPAAVAHLERGIDPARTIFLVSSKSGGTTETLSFYKYFRSRVETLKGKRAGANFVAITDPDTSLEKLARDEGFRGVFDGNPAIGGRYSALSNFGMVPAALAGIDVKTILERAERMAQMCGPGVAVKDNPGVQLGILLGEAAAIGRDKITLSISPGIRSFGDWVEQLLAESTGKEGKGVVPVVGENLGEPNVYGDDRFFVHMQLESEAESVADVRLKSLSAAGHPVLKINLRDKLDLGQEFFRWEIATATAGAILGVDPFDQPNVQESKDNTNRQISRFKSEGRLREEAPTPENYLAAFLRLTRPGDYIALLAYLEPSSENKALLESIRMKLRDGLRLATTLGFGPRYLHSTGQLHKGGPDRGVFIQVTAEDPSDLPVPGEPYTFSTLKRAQALGDMQSLEARGRRAVRFHLGKDVQAGLDRLLSATVAGLESVRPAGLAR